MMKETRVTEPRTGPARFGSAHLIALLALCLAVGGGIAVAGGQRSTPAPTVGYQLADAEQRTQPGGRVNLVNQLVVPSRGFYSVNAKLNVAKATGADFSNGPITCYLGGIGSGDSSSITVGKGDIASLSLQSMGGKARGKGRQAFDLSCSGFDSSYVVSDVRISAIRLDRAKLG